MIAKIRFFFNHICFSILFFDYEKIIFLFEYYNFKYISFIYVLSFFIKLPKKLP